MTSDTDLVRVLDRIATALENLGTCIEEHYIDDYDRERTVFRIHGSIANRFTGIGTRAERRKNDGTTESND